MTEPILFEQARTPIAITLQATEDGELLRFRNAILCRAEANLNDDELTPQNIAELAASLAGRAIDIDHNRQANAGIITEARVEGEAVAIDGILWKDRYPVQIAGVQAGSHHLSVEASAVAAICSVCERRFEGAADYCQHLKARKLYAARRRFEGLSGEGAGITATPAGTRTQFDRNQIFVVASHQEAPMTCPHCNSDAGDGPKCARCGKSVSATLLVAELSTAQAELATALTNLSAAQAETAQTIEKVVPDPLVAAELETTKTALTATQTELTAALDKLAGIEAAGRESAVRAFLAEAAWTERKDQFLKMDAPTFAVVLASLKDAKPTGTVRLAAGLRSGMPEPVAGSEAPAVTIRLK